ncbi:MAG: M18 family aminopeptidase [Lachnospiraceae bacterium]
MNLLKKVDYTKELLSYIDKSKSPFHAIDVTRAFLQGEGFEELNEKASWSIKKGRSYFVTRNDSSIIAFTTPKNAVAGFHMVASHSDSPSFKVKEHGEMGVEGVYTKLNVERYGGMIMNTWFDRPLSVAGRLYVNSEKGIVRKLIDIDEDMMVIPNLAIHMNREINDGYKYNAQTDMCPLVCVSTGTDKFMEYVASAAGVKAEDILGQDLYLYTRESGRVIGMEKDMILSPRLDDLACAYTSVQALAESIPTDYINVCAILDNEEVGSSTRQGADSDFLENTLKRIVYAFGGTEETYMKAIADSFMISADNAHALHPNHTAKADPTNRPVLNGGIVIKYSSNQKYTTDAKTGSVMKKICMDAGVPFQTFYNRSDMLGGSTLGNISTTHVSVPSVDIGMPQLAMHSAVETAGVKDVAYMVQAFKGFYKS